MRSLLERINGGPTPGPVVGVAASAGAVVVVTAVIYGLERWVPVLEELGFGHGDGSLTVPLGLPAVLDTEAATLTLRIPALS